MNQQFYCIVCNRKHGICLNCYNNTKYFDNNLIYNCCNQCHLNSEDKKLVDNWKNQYLFFKNYKKINYTSWLRIHMVNLLLIMVYNITQKNISLPYLPKELWFQIFSNINCNHFTMYLHKYHNKGYCDLCGVYQ